MAFDYEKLKQIAVPLNDAEIEKANTRKRNRDWVHMSQDIALCLHYYIDMFGITQKELAERMDVSPAHIAKLLKGGENMTLETICKLQKAIGKSIVTINKPYANGMTVSMSSYNPNSVGNVFNLFGARISLNNNAITQSSTALVS